MRKNTFIVTVLLVLVPFGLRADQVVPAGTIIQCITAEGRISSKTAALGDPVLCQVSRFTAFGRSVLPYGSYLAGTFDDYKDPGRFIGKGWMVLKFDRLVISPDTIIPIETKVVDVPNYPVDNEGKIHGKGHAVRDVLTWSIPILWPVDLLELPRRGPRPTLKAETKITVKVMDDIEIPQFQDLPESPSQPTLKQRPASYEAQPLPQPQYYVAGPDAYPEFYQSQAPSAVVYPSAPVGYAAYFMSPSPFYRGPVGYAGYYSPQGRPIYRAPGGYRTAPMYGGPVARAHAYARR